MSDYVNDLVEAIATSNAKKAAKLFDSSAELQRYKDFVSSVVQPALEEAADIARKLGEGRTVQIIHNHLYIDKPCQSEYPYGLSREPGKALVVRQEFSYGIHRDSNQADKIAFLQFVLTENMITGQKNVIKKIPLEMSVSKDELVKIIIGHYKDILLK